LLILVKGILINNIGSHNQDLEKRKLLLEQNSNKFIFSFNIHNIINESLMFEIKKKFILKKIHNENLEIKKENLLLFYNSQKKILQKHDNKDINFPLIKRLKNNGKLIIPEGL
jgi:hypothetical protein